MFWGRPPKTMKRLVLQTYKIFSLWNIPYEVYLDSRVRKQDMPRTASGPDITTLTALAEANRIRIVELLRDGPLTVGEIAERLDLRQPQASKHLKVLNETGILEVKAEANRRIYKLRNEPFQKLEDWLRTFPRVMEERFDNLDGYLRALREKKKS